MTVVVFILAAIPTLLFFTNLTAYRRPKSRREAAVSVLIPARNEAGNILLQLGKYDKAWYWFVSAFLIDQKDQAAKDGMRKCLKKMGNNELMERYRSILGEQP